MNEHLLIQGLLLDNFSRLFNNKHLNNSYHLFYYGNYDTKNSEDLVEIKSELSRLRTLVAEDYELADDVIEELEESKSRSHDEMINHEEMRKEFNNFSCNRS